MISPRQQSNAIRTCLYEQFNPANEQVIHKDNDSLEEVKENGSTLGAWVPVGSISSLSTLTPIRVEIMGRNFVVWDSPNVNSPVPSQRSSPLRSLLKKPKPSVTWSVMADVCPHRLAPLSLGRVDQESGCIECVYHGWQFESNGTLSHLPQLEEGKSLTSIQERGSAESFSTYLTGDLLWAFLPTEMHGESFPKSLLPDQYFDGLQADMERGALYSSHEMPSSFEITVENAFDPSHFPFTHHGVVSKRSDGGPMPMKTITSNFTRVDVKTSYIRNNEARDRLFSFQRPFLLYTQEQDREDNWKAASKFFIVPIREGRSRIITSVEKLSKRWFPSWIVHVLITRLFSGDYILHDAERERQGGGVYFNPTSADNSVIAWQKWFAQSGMEDSPPHTFRSASLDNLKPLPRREYEDQWLAHTYACSECRGALRGARRIRILAGAVGVVLTAALRKTHPRFALAACFSALLSTWAAQRVIRFLEGTIRPSDASDRHWSTYQ